MGRVFYVTNRTPDNAAAPASYGIDFNQRIPGSLTYGVADVAAPPGHEATGLPNEATTPQAVQISNSSAGDFSAAAKERSSRARPIWWSRCMASSICSGKR